MGDRKMEGEDSVRTVDCLRGRLLAERAASKNANEEAQQLQNKLMELEKLLRQEAKSRNKAEKKLKFLMKKLQSINVSDESEHSGLIDNKTDVSSISSTPSSIEKQQQIKVSEANEIQGSKGVATLQMDLGNLKQIDTQNCSSSHSDEGASISSSFEVFKGLECETRRDKDATFEDSISSASDQQSGFCCGSNRSSAGEGSQVDDSMALVVVDTSQRSRRIDPEALDASVREVLDTLRRAKEELRSSMARRRMKMVGVGETNLSVKASTIFI